MRWNHPSRGRLAPDQFISVAEESGYIIPLSLWVIEQACRQLKLWDGAGLPIPRVAINVSAVHFRQQGFHEEVRSVLQSHSIDPSLLELELTEGSLMEDTEGTRACLRSLKRIGVRLAIDDFGTGYSCLSYLRRFPLDVLKVDRSFVSDLHTSGDAQAICSAILSIASRLSLDAVAEGIESEQQLAFLTKHGCQFGQGFYFSAPVAGADIGTMMAQRGAEIARPRRVHTSSAAVTAR